MGKIFQFFRDCKLPGRYLGFLAFFNLCIAALSLAQPEVLRRATNAITEQSTQLLVQTLILAGIAAVLNMVIVYRKDIYTVLTRNVYEKALSNRLLDKIIDTKMGRLNQKQFGDISTVLIRNTENYILSAVTAVSECSAGIISLTLTFVYMLCLSWRLALCILIYNMIIRFFAIFVERKIKKNSMEMTDAMKESGNYLVSLLTNMFTVRIYSDRDFLRKLFRQKETRVMQANLRSFVWSNGYQDFIWAFSKAAEFFVVYSVGSWLIFRNLADISILLTFVFANDLFTIGINNIANYASAKAEAEAYQISIEEILTETELESGSCDTSFADHFSIRFEEVSFSYGSRQILEKVSFTIPMGEKVLLRGANGTGKSTILKLLAGLYRPDSGNIYYGDENINDIHISCLTDTYGYISQHSNILEGDTLTNLSLRKSTDTNKANEILRKMKLSRIQNNNPGSFSQGEQQRLNIGRVFYRSKPVFILGDEIFSNIDAGNRMNIIELLNREYADATVILITHEEIDYRFDRILTLCNGKITQEVQNEAI